MLLMPLLLLRHASAGDRDAWEDEDHERPLDERGFAQAAALVEQLEPFAVERILSSPALRCTQTVEPIAEARGLPIEVRDELSERRQATDGAVLVASLEDGNLLICGHGGLDDRLPDPPRKWRKGATLVLGRGLVVNAQLPPPA
jgi:8-oxo-(d)GTP phosphatase